jgi:DNA-binding MarR family transcriptional regulator
MNRFAYKKAMGGNAVARKSRDLLELFYPIHYKAGMALEDAMRARVLTRKQVAVLWLLRTEGAGRVGVRRKDIERSIKSWFEISSSAITKTIRKMARAPLKLVEMTESPDSGREKRVFLTRRGEDFIATMLSRGEKFLKELVEQLPDEEVEGGIEFLRDSIVVLERGRAHRDGPAPIVRGISSGPHPPVSARRRT